MLKSTRSCVGKWLRRIVLLACISSMVGCSNQTVKPTLNTSSQIALKESVDTMLESLSDQPTKQAKLGMAFKMISMSSVGNQGDITFQDVWDKYNGLTADELIASKPLGVDIESMDVDPTALAASNLNRESQNRMRQIVLAMHNYHSAFSAFPAQFSQNEGGKPLLSWRVHLLPFLGENDLYDQFKLDEPWDSDHNVNLVEQMPDCYSHPKLKPGRTVYVAPVGKESIWRRPKYEAGGRGTHTGNIADGSYNTVALIEVPADQAVAWTKPADFDIDTPGFSKKLQTNGRFINVNVAAADASLFVLRSDLSEEQWRLAFGANDGDRRDPRQFRSNR